VNLQRRLTPLAHRLDHSIGRLSPGRSVLVELRTPVYHAVLSPIADALCEQRAVSVWYTGEQPGRVLPLVGAERFLTHREAEWRRFDLYLNGDPWAAVRLRRCARRINFFHGVAGKYDLDDPKGLPLGFELYDRVAFINRDRMERYLAAGIVTKGQAALVGYPKLDDLANGLIDTSVIRTRYQLDDRPTALYAPTYSDASSLHLAGTEIVRALAAAGFNVLVKLHDRSLDSDPRYTGGVDWRGRFTSLAAERARGRIHFVDVPDACPLLAVSDVMVTDHSSIGFEYLVLDRPLIVFDAPGLQTAARVNPEKIAMLRSAATVVRTPDETARAATAAVANPSEASAARRCIAREMFFEPGGATARALQLARDLLFTASAAVSAAPTVEHGDTV